MTTTATADLCEVFLPLVFGGELGNDTVIAPGAWRGREWPCTGRKATNIAGLVIECSCGCHAGAFEHELPPRADRTAVHPTDVLADG